MSNADLLKQFVNVYGDFVEPLQSFRWDGSTQGYIVDIIKRAALVRQWECLQAQALLASGNFGHCSAAFLRQGYEELIWLTYLDTVPNHSGEIISIMGMDGISRAVRGQLKYLGADVMIELGWRTPDLIRYGVTAPQIKDRIGKIGKELGWPGGKSNFFFLSKKVNREREYGFLYHATSSFVHFSPHELFRRVWGKHGEVTIGSSRFSDFWTEFAAYWSARTFIELLISSESVLSQEPMPPGRAQEVLDIARAMVPIPIITPEELVSWPEPAVK